MDLNDWKGEIRRAKLYLEHQGRMEKWRRYRNWYRNVYPSGVVSVNKVFGVGRAIVPQLYFKSPTIVCRARKPMFSQMAKVLEAVDSWLIDHIGFKMQVKQMILDAYQVNVGVGKVGYHSIATELPTPSPETTEAVAEMLGAAPQELEDELQRRRWSYHDYIRPDSPWFLRIRPQDALVPWGYYDEHEVPWMAFRIIRPLEDVKHDPIYHNTSRLAPNVKPDTGTAGVVSPNLFGKEASGDFVEMFEIWDKRDGMVHVLSIDHDKWLRNEDHQMEIHGVPGSILRFNPDGEDFWGVSDVEQIHKQVIELNENRTHEMETKRLANVKGLIDTNIIDEAELTKLEKGKPGPLVRTNGPAQGAFTQFSITVPPDLYRIDDIIDKDIREVIGFSRNQSGEFDVPRRTATEANIVREASLLRSDERRDLVADLIKEVFQDKMHPLIFQNWTQQRTIEVTALGGWIKYTGEQIKGDYDVTVVPDSTLPVSKQQEQQLAIQALQMFNNDPWIKQRRLRERVLETFKEIIPDPSELLLSEEEFQKQQQQQMLMAVLQAGAGGGQQRGGAQRPGVQARPQAGAAR